MSWDVLLLKLPQEAMSPADIPDRYENPTIGSRAEVVSALQKLFRDVEGGDDSFVTVDSSAFAIEISLGDDECCSALLLHVHGDQAKAKKSILRIAEHFGLRAIDCSTNEFIKKGRRREVEENQKTPVPQQEWTLPGLGSWPCERYVYVSLLPGESPKQQQKAVFRHWGELFKKHGELPTSIMGPSFHFGLPNGEVFGDFSVRRYPGLTETKSEMIPHVQKAVRLVHAFAVATGRKSGEIENDSEFVCTDGQRIPLAQCIYYHLRTEADYAKKLKRQKGK